MKKKISYSLFGYDLKYYIGAEKNITINQSLLKDWDTVIYYHPDNIIKEYLEKLKALGAVMVNIEEQILIKKSPHEFPYFWRFFALLDDNISLIRDLDSRISKREVEYINRWLESNKNYLIIRDHPWQSKIPSGLFGVKGFKKEFGIFLKSFIENTDIKWGDDQIILENFMDFVDHGEIEYFGYDKKDTYIERDDLNFFIGIQLNEYDKPTIPSGEISLEYLNKLL